MRCLLPFIAICCTLCAGDTWVFKTPPSASKRVVVDADWRGYDQVQLRFDVTPAEIDWEQIQCTVFLETKQGWWFESRQTFKLRPGRAEVTLRLDADSPDWRADSLCREYGSDVLAWVRSWGIKVFSPLQQEITITQPQLTFLKHRPVPMKITRVSRTERFAVGNVGAIQYRLHGFRGNPFAKREVDASLTVAGNGVQRRLPFCFRQDYVERRKPWEKRATKQPLDLPVWQANWAPVKAGVYQLSVLFKVGNQVLRDDLGQVTVMPRSPAEEASTPSGALENIHEKGLLYRWENDDWVPVPGQKPHHVQLDWTPKWGTYTGLGKMDQGLAWDFEQSLKRGDAARGPVLVFSEDELDDTGVYNWKENPLNRVNGGPLRNAGAFFADKASRELILDRARYLLARYAAYGRFTGVLLRVNRPQQAAVTWLRDVSVVLRQEFPGLEIYADSPGLPLRSKIRPLKLGQLWRTDKRLAPLTKIDPSPSGLIVKGEYPGTTAIVVHERMQHWSKGDVFSVDVHCSKGAGSWMKAMCFLRTSTGDCFQSELLSLREDDWNRLHFRLKKGTAWTCVSRPGRRLDDLQLMNLREVALRFFCDDKRDVQLCVRDARLLEISKHAMSILPAMAVTSRGLPVKKLRQGDRFKLDFDLNRDIANPYDQKEVRARLKIRGPERTTVDGFYYEPWKLVRTKGLERAVPAGKPHWRVYFTPREAGNYEWELRVHCGKEVSTQTGSFVAEQGQVRFLPRDFKVSDLHLHEPLSPLGEAGAMPHFHVRAGTKGGIEVNRIISWLAKVKASGKNLVRLGLCPNWSGLEWSHRLEGNHGLGYYNQANAMRLDEVIAAAEKLGMYIEFVATNHAHAGHGEEGRYNPYLLQNGGFLRRPGDLHGNPEAVRLHKQKLRYIVARWGHSPAIAFWNLHADPRVMEPNCVVSAKISSGRIPAAGYVEHRSGHAPQRWISAGAEITGSRDGHRHLCSSDHARPRSGLFARPGREPLGSATVRLNLKEHWTTDARLAKFTFLRRSKTRPLSIDGRYRGSTAITVNRVTQHWHGAKLLVVDVENSDRAGDNVKGMCFIRTSLGHCYQSKLIWLREDDWNRLYFPLQDASFWTCLSEKGRQLASWELLNVTEVALRFFCDEDNDVTLKVRNPHLVYPRESTQSALAITALRKAPAKVAQYGKFEFDFDLNRAFTNPYDPREIDVKIQLTGPDGRRIVHPAYFHEQWRLDMKAGKEVPSPAGRPFWRVRVAPTLLGNYSWILVAQTRDEAATLRGRFASIRGKSKGFVGVSNRDEQYFEFSDGSFFFPIGHNLRSPSDRRPGVYSAKTLLNVDRSERLGTRAYDKWFATLRKNGENFTRVWMCPWWTGLEWNRDTPGYHGVGYYNQQNAARLDRIIEAAEREGIYLNLETANHGMFSTGIDGDWKDNPYAKNHPGGFLRFATDFFHSRRAKELHRQKLRYAIARWGYSTSIAIWGIITEAEWTEPYFRGFDWGKVDDKHPRSMIPQPYKTKQHRQVVRNWIVETGEYLRQTDAHPHVVTVHFSNPPNGVEIWDHEAIEVVHNNAYTLFASFWRKQHFKHSRGVADVMFEYARFFGHHDKPVIIGEWGGDPKKNTERHLLAEYHLGLWANFMVPTAGVTGYWWWNLIDSEQRYGDFKAIAAFAKGIDRRGKNFESSRAVLSFVAHHGLSWQRMGLVLCGRDELYAYIYPRSMNTYKSSQPATSWNDRAFVASGMGTLEAPRRLRPGNYVVEYWDTFAGKVVKTAKCQIDRHRRRIPLIDHRVDLAIKVKPVQQ